MLVDPLGTGDSPGEFEDATWKAWIEDVVRAHRWLSDETGAVAGLWALRGGALLAAAALSRIGPVPRLLLWQPMQSGKTLLQQFLRLKVAAVAIGTASSSQGGSQTTGDILERLNKGEAVEVAGYMLPPALALPLSEADLTIANLVERITWLEVSALDPPTLTPASQTRIRDLGMAQLNIDAKAVLGPSFWLTQEIEECDALIEETLRLVDVA